MVTAAKVVSLPIWTAVACKQVSLPLCVCGGSVGGLVMQCAARASRQRSHSPARVTLLCPSLVGLPPLQGGPGRRAVPVRLRLADSPTVAWRDYSSGVQAPSDYPPAHAHASARPYSRAWRGGDGYKQGALCKLCTWNEEEKQRNRIHLPGFPALRLDRGMEEGLEGPTAALPIEEGEVGYRSLCSAAFHD